MKDHILGITLTENLLDFIGKKKKKKDSDYENYMLFLFSSQQNYLYQALLIYQALYQYFLISPPSNTMKYLLLSPLAFLDDRGSR